MALKVTAPRKTSGGATCVAAPWAKSKWKADVPRPLQPKPRHGEIQTSQNMVRCFAQVQNAKSQAAPGTTPPGLFLLLSLDEDIFCETTFKVRQRGGMSEAPFNGRLYNSYSELADLELANQQLNSGNEPRNKAIGTGPALHLSVCTRPVTFLHRLGEDSLYGRL